MVLMHFVMVPYEKHENFLFSQLAAGTLPLYSSKAEAQNLLDIANHSNSDNNY